MYMKECLYRHDVFIKISLQASVYFQSLKAKIAEES